MFHRFHKPPAKRQLAPARLQFIEREFHEALTGNTDPNLVWEIHDAIFLEGKSLAIVRDELSKRHHSARFIAVTSGKGGAGKTTVAVNLAVALAGLRGRVLLFDADLGMANAHVFSGVNPRGTLLDVVEGRASLAQIVTTGPAGVQVVCGASGVAGLADLNLRIVEFLRGELVRFADAFDFVVIDTGAGISSQVMRFLSIAHEMIVVVTPNLASTLDAYGVIKVARETKLSARIHVLVNQCEEDAQATSVYERMRACAERFLQFSPLHLGTLRSDAAIEAANQSRQPLMIAKPRNKNAQRFETIAERLAELKPSTSTLPVSSTPAAPFSRSVLVS